MADKAEELARELCEKWNSMGNDIPRVAALLRPHLGGDEKFEQWLAESRKLNPTCGCERRGSRWSRCSYHEGAEDGWEAAGLPAPPAEEER